MSSHLNCFICLSKLTLPKDRESKLKLKQTIQKIFQYLAISDKDFNEVYSSLESSISFCQDCSKTVQDIVELQKKVTTLELLIQNKVETFGSVIAKTEQISPEKINSEGDKLPWEKFRNPVIQNYGKGFLPKPYISLSRCKSSLLPCIASTSKDVSCNMDLLPFDSDSNSRTSSFSEHESEIIRIKATPTLPPTRPKLKGERNPSSEAISEAKENNTDDSHKRQDYFECSICSFKSIIEPDESKKLCQSRKKARSKMYSHFNSDHNPVESKDISIDKVEGKEFFKCTLCNFCYYVNDSIKGKKYLHQKRGSARLGLSRHYLLTHHKIKEVTKQYVSKEDEKSPKESIPLKVKMTKPGNEETEDLVEGEDYFSCPNEECSFIEILSNIQSPKDYETKKRSAIYSITKHHLRAHAAHNIEMEDGEKWKFKISSYPFMIQMEDGRDGFKCPNQNPKCDFLQVMDYPKDKKASEVRKVQFRIFSRHYLSHIEIKRSDCMVRTLKCEVEKCGFITCASQDLIYPLKYPSERGTKLKEQMNQHYQKAHSKKSIFPDEKEQDLEENSNFLKSWLEFEEPEMIIVESGLWLDFEGEDSETEMEESEIQYFKNENFHVEEEIAVKTECIAFDFEESERMECNDYDYILP